MLFRSKKFVKGGLEKIAKIIHNQNVYEGSNRMDWKIVLGDRGNWGYTTKKHLKVGMYVVYKFHDDQFNYYVDGEVTDMLNKELS